MAEENKLHHEEENKEVSSTQHTDAQNDAQLKEKVIEPLEVVNVKPSSTFKLASFTGDAAKVKISNWMRMYENLAKRVNWSDDEMKWNLASYLDQEAFDFYIDHVLSKKLDWNDAKQAVLKRFDQFEIEPFMQFLSQKWSPQVELKEYFQKMRALGTAAGLEEKDILSGLTRGLPVHLRSELNFVTSLQQWVAVAFCLQQRFEDNNNSHNKHQPWKGGFNRRGGNRNNSNRPNKLRSNHQQSDHTVLQSAANDHNDA